MLQAAETVAPKDSEAEPRRNEVEKCRALEHKIKPIL